MGWCIMSISGSVEGRILPHSEYRRGGGCPAWRAVLSGSVVVYGDVLFVFTPYVLFIYNGHRTMTTPAASLISRAVVPEHSHRSPRHDYPSTHRSSRPFIGFGFLLPIAETARPHTAARRSASLA